MASVTLWDAERGNTYRLKRINAHAKRRELSTSVLGDCCLIPQLSDDKNQKWTFLDEPSDQRSSAVLYPIIFYLSIRFSVL